MSAAAGGASLPGSSAGSAAAASGSSPAPAGGSAGAASAAATTAPAGAASAAATTAPPVSAAGGGGATTTATLLSGAAAAVQPPRWKLVHTLHDEAPGDADMVTTISFSPTGKYLAQGDKLGRVVVFEAKAGAKSDVDSGGRAAQAHSDYSFLTEFTSHQAEFDCLKNIEIDERINALEWLPPFAAGASMLVANDRKIKLWRVGERRVWDSSTGPAAGGKASTAAQAARLLTLPSRGRRRTCVQSQCKHVYGGTAHPYHIHSLSVNSDAETFISADDLRINLWSLETDVNTFNIVDVTPSRMEELNEVITCALFHPRHCHIMLYGTSKGSAKLGDMRQAALCDQHAKQFDMVEDEASRSFFTDVVRTVSDLRFAGDGQQFVMRDFFSLSLWDIRQESHPVEVIPVHDYLRPHLADLYDNDAIFDRFPCCSSPDGRRFLTGSYQHHLVVADLATRTVATLEAGRDDAVAVNPFVAPGAGRFAAPGSGARPVSSPVGDKIGKTRPGGPSSSGAAADKNSTPPNKKTGDKKNKTGSGFPNGAGPAALSFSSVDFTLKSLRMAWHPKLNFFAAAIPSKLLFYSLAPASGASGAEGGAATGGPGSASSAAST